MSIRMPFPACVAAAMLMAVPSLWAQQSVTPVPSDSTDGAAAQSQTPPAGTTTGPLATDAKKKMPKSLPPAHRFWDRENDLLFAGVAAGRGLDYSSTLNLRRRGID